MNFTTARRRVVVADAPGHEQYTRNMVTAASGSQAALMLVDARKGIVAQSRRHANILSLMGIRHVALAINKMDLAENREARFREIVSEFEAVMTGLNENTIKVKLFRARQKLVKAAARLGRTSSVLK